MDAIFLYATIKLLRKGGISYEAELRLAVWLG